MFHFSVSFVLRRVEDDTQYLIQSEVDGQMVTLDKDTGRLMMMTSNETSSWQRWLVARVPGTESVQFISVETGETLSLRGMSDFSLGEDTEAGLSGSYVTITATGGLVYTRNIMKPVAWTDPIRGPDVEGTLNAYHCCHRTQKFKFIPIET